MRISVMTLLTVAAVCGCEPGIPEVHTTNKPVPNQNAETATPATAPAGMPATTESHAADNSSVNTRDRDPAAKTPIDQNENEADIKITADIRKRVLEQPDFSVNARNVKIITAEGKVTLRGPVTTEAERDTINKIAQEIAGQDKVDSQLEVTP